MLAADSSYFLIRKLFAPLIGKPFTTKDVKSWKEWTVKLGKNSSLTNSGSISPISTGRSMA